MDRHLHTRHAERADTQRRRLRARGKRGRDPTPQRDALGGRTAQLPIATPSPYDAGRGCSYNAGGDC